MIPDYHPYTRVELRVVASVKWPDCKCQDYEPADSDDWIGLHCQLIAEGWG